MDEQQRPWHRLFGSLKKQLLDFLLIRKEAGLDFELPDGVLANFNLITFKSHQEKLSIWSLKELVGHYVNLRKQISPSMNKADLLPPKEFSLFAVSVHYPQKLSKVVELEQVKSGVYDFKNFGERTQLIVVNQLVDH